MAFKSIIQISGKPFSLQVKMVLLFMHWLALLADFFKVLSRVASLNAAAVKRLTLTSVVKKKITVKLFFAGKPATKKTTKSTKTRQTEETQEEPSSEKEEKA